MSRRRRVVIVAGCLCFAALALWWSVYFPYAPQRVRAAIPANAILVSEHYHLAKDVDALRHHPALREAVKVLGGDVEGIDGFMTSRFGRWLTRCLGGRYSLVAYASYVPPGGPPCWMMASWGGARAQVMRWLMDGGWIPGWTRLPGRSPIACYMLDGPGDGPVLSAAISEGVVLMCYSRDASAVRAMTRRLVYGEEASDLPGVDPDGPERAQVRWLSAAPESPRAELTWAISATNRLAVRARWPVGMPLPMLQSWGQRGDFIGLMPAAALPAVAGPLAGTPDAADLRHLQAGLGRVAGGLVLGPTALLDGLMTGLQDPEDVQRYEETVSPWLNKEGTLAVGLLRESYSGRLLGIKTPSLVLAVKTRAELDLAAELPALLDRCNAAFGLALLARERAAEEGGETFFIIDDARNGIYASMKATEKPAVWQHGDWLWVASNLEAARAVRGQMADAAADALPQGAWWSDVATQPDGVHGWVDFAAAGQAVRKLSALYAIVQIAQGARSGPAVMRMEQTGRVVNALEPFVEGAAHVTIGPGAWTLEAGVGR